MELDRRALLVSLASSAAMLALPGGAAAAFETECFAAARKDDRGTYSAALFSLTAATFAPSNCPPAATTSR